MNQENIVNSVIGGEFDISISSLPVAAEYVTMPWEYCYASGRAALYQIAKHLMKTKSISEILLPDYLCDSIITTIESLGIRILFYPLDEHLILKQKDFKFLYKSNTPVMLINYFGMMNLHQQMLFIRSLDDHAIIIEDDVQAYYEYQKDLGLADFKFTSLRKSFAIPDGGLVKTNEMLPRLTQPNTFAQYKLVGSIVKHLRGTYIDDDSIYLQLFERGEEYINSNLEADMSIVSKQLLANVDLKYSAKRRKINSQVIINGLQSMMHPPRQIIDYQYDKIPSFVPIYLNNRDVVRKKLFDAFIFAPVHWPIKNFNLTRGNDLASHELSLIIDQRYTEHDMNRLLNILEDAMKYE